MVHWTRRDKNLPSQLTENVLLLNYYKLWKCYFFWGRYRKIKSFILETTNLTDLKLFLNDSCMVHYKFYVSIWTNNTRWQINIGPYGKMIWKSSIIIVDYCVKYQHRIIIVDYFVKYQHSIIIVDYFVKYQHRIIIVDYFVKYQHSIIIVDYLVEKANFYLSWSNGPCGLLSLLLCCRLTSSLKLQCKMESNFVILGPIQKSM
jgi:hypothetical protein